MSWQAADSMDQPYSFLGFPERLYLWQRFLPYALLLSVTFALYGTTLYFNFVWDDFSYVLENYQIQGLSPARLRAIWTISFLGQYAPLHHTFLALLYSLSGLEPFGYHLGQLLLHAACVCLLYFVLKNIESARVALLASLLFAVFPPNIETVAWISETKSTLAFLFFLLSFWAFLRLRARERWSDGLWCALFLILSVLSKINTVAAPVIFLLYDYKQGYALKKGRVRSLAAFFLISAVFTGIHLASSFGVIRGSAGMLMDAVLTDGNQPRFNESSGYYGGAYVHLLNMPRLLLFYVRMLFFPHPLTGWHMFRVYEQLNWIAGAAWIALIGLLWLLYRSPRSVQFWALWFFVFLAPVLQIIPIPIWVADRYLYVPAIGAFVLGSKLFFHISDRFGKLWLRLSWDGVMAAILLAFAWQVHNHLPVWRDDLTFWKATTKTCMTSAFCHSRLGKSLLRNGYPELAVREFSQAIQIGPEPLYYIYLGDAYTDSLGDYQRALQAYRAAQQKSRGMLPFEILGKVAKAYYLAGELEQASRIIQAGQKMNADDPSLLLVNGFLEWKQGNWEQARRSMQRVLDLNAVNPQTSNPARFIYDYWGNTAEVGRLLADLGSLQSGPFPMRPVAPREREK